MKLDLQSSATLITLVIKSKSLNLALLVWIHKILRRTANPQDSCLGNIAGFDGFQSPFQTWDDAILWDHSGYKFCFLPPDSCVNGFPFIYTQISNTVALDNHVFEFTCKLRPQTFVCVLAFFYLHLWRNAIYFCVTCGHVGLLSVAQLMLCKDTVIQRPSWEFRAGERCPGQKWEVGAERCVELGHPHQPTDARRIVGCQLSPVQWKTATFQNTHPFLSNLYIWLVFIFGTCLSQEKKQACREIK